MVFVSSAAVEAASIERPQAELDVVTCNNPQATCTWTPAEVFHPKYNWQSPHLVIVSLCCLSCQRCTGCGCSSYPCCISLCGSRNDFSLFYQRTPRFRWLRALGVSTPLWLFRSICLCAAVFIHGGFFSFPCTCLQAGLERVGQVSNRLLCISIRMSIFWYWNHYGFRVDSQQVPSPPTA